MTKNIFLIIAVIINLIIMIYTIKRITRLKVYKKYSKSTLIYITIIVPIIGFFLTKSEESSKLN